MVGSSEDIYSLLTDCRRLIILSHLTKVKETLECKSESLALQKPLEDP